MQMVRYHPKVGPSQFSIQSQLSYIKSSNHIAVPLTLSNPREGFPSDDYRITDHRLRRKTIQPTTIVLLYARLKGRNM